MSIFVIVILILFIFWCISQLYFITRGRAPWFPTPPRAFKIICDRIQLEPGESFAEVGAGTGRLALEIARRYPDNPVFAYEIGYAPFVIGQLNALQYPNVRFVRADFRLCNLGHINICYSFTNPAITQTLAHQLITTANKPIKLYSLAFRVSDRQATETIPSGRQSVYLYQF